MIKAIIIQKELKGVKEAEMKQKSRLVIGVALGLILPSFLMANGLNLNSLGSRALAMGGAFVGLADDYSVIFWNPAGIALFKTRAFGFYGTDLIPSGKYKLEVPVPNLGTLTMVNAKTQSKHYLAGLAAYYHPIAENLVAGIGVFVPSGLGAAWDGSDFAAIAENKTYEWSSRIGVVTIAPAIAYKVNDQFLVGGTLNLNYGSFDISMHAGSAEIPVPPYKVDLGQYEESMNGWGMGATFGLLVRPNEKFSLGATFRTRSTIKFKGNAAISNIYLIGLNKESDVERNVTYPTWLAFGLAFKPITALTITADLQWSEWKTIDVMKTDFLDPGWKLLMALSGDDAREMHWKSVMQMRLGAEYTLPNNWAIRAGYYWDPSPAPDTTMNVLLPSYDFNVLTFGVGYTLGDLKLDFGFEYLKGQERKVSYVDVMTKPEYHSAMPGIYNMTIIVPNISISYRF